MVLKTKNAFLQIKKGTLKINKNQTLERIAVLNYPKIWTVFVFHREIGWKHAERMTNSVDPDQTAPSGAAWPGFTLFAQSLEKLGSFW